MSCFFSSSCFTNLELAGCAFNSIGVISWVKLKSLSIYNGKLNEDLIRNILSGSPILETLNLYNCYGYRRLDITSKSVKNLVFWSYRVPNTESKHYPNIIKINAPNIMSLTIKGELNLGKILLLDVSSLVNAQLNYKMPGVYGRKQEEAIMLKEFILNLHGSTMSRILKLSFSALRKIYLCLNCIDYSWEKTA